MARLPAPWQGARVLPFQENPTAMDSDDGAAVLAARLRLNAGRLAWLMPALLVTHVLHVAAFSLLAVGDGSAASELWRGRIVACHVGLALLAGTLAVWSRTAHASRATWPWPMVTTAYLWAAASVAGVDQLVTPVITPFLVASFALPLVLRLERREALLAYGLGFLGFAVVVIVAQPSPDIRASQLVNGITIGGLGLAMELMFTRAFVQAEVARLTIQRQKGELDVLRGMLCVCSYCLKIRNEAQKWEPLDRYISRHSDTRFSHGICEECYARVTKDLPAPE
jgi:hypothetical protein